MSYAAKESNTSVDLAKVFDLANKTSEAVLDAAVTQYPEGKPGHRGFLADNVQYLMRKDTSKLGVTQRIHAHETQEDFGAAVKTYSFIAALTAVATGIVKNQRYGTSGSQNETFRKFWSQIDAAQNSLINVVADHFVLQYSESEGTRRNVGEHRLDAKEIVKKIVEITESNIEQSLARAR